MGRALTAVGLVVILAGTAAALLAATSRSRAPIAPPGPLVLPNSLGGEPLIASVQGPDALLEVARLHGKRIDAVDAAVGRYRSGMTVWISASATPLAASSLLWAMNRRLAGGTRVFSAPRPEERHGRTIFATNGDGQRHFYYQSGARILWLAASPTAADPAIDDLLAAYP